MSVTTLGENEIGYCYFCGKLVGGWAFCFGCLYCVCPNCDKEHPVGQHQVEAHRFSEADEEITNEI